MSISTYQKPTSYNITYTAPHQKLAPDVLSEVQNKSKLLYNDENGQVGFYDGGLLLDIESYATTADFPTTGESNKFYLATLENKMYRWANAQYYYFPHEVYSKTESNDRYYEKINTYTKTETDTKYPIRLNTNNDMTNSEINNLNALSVLNCLTANQTSVSITKPLNAGWNNVNFLAQINDKIKLDEIATKMLTDVNMNANDLNNVETANIDNVKTNTIQTLASVPIITTALNKANMQTTLNMNLNNIENCTNINNKITLNGIGLLLTDNVNCNNNTLSGITTLTSTTGNITTINSTTANITTVSGVTELTATTVKTGNLKATDDTLIAVVGNTGIEYKDGKQIRLGHGNINREANAGVISYGHAAFPDSLAIIGKSPTTVYNNDRKITLTDVVSVGNKLTTPKLDITDNYGINGKIRFNGLGTDVLTRLYMNGNNITEAGIVVSDNVYTDKLFNKAGTQEKIDLTTTGKTIIKTPLDLGNNATTNASSIGTDFLRAKDGIQTKMDLSQPAKLVMTTSFDLNGNAILNAGNMNLRPVEQFVKPVIFFDNALSGMNLFEYNAPLDYKIYSALWTQNNVPITSGVLITTVYTSVSASFSAGDAVRCMILLVRD